MSKSLKLQKFKVRSKADFSVFPLSLEFTEVYTLPFLWKEMFQYATTDWHHKNKSCFPNTFWLMRFSFRQQGVEGKKHDKVTMTTPYCCARYLNPHCLRILTRLSTLPLAGRMSQEFVHERRQKGVDRAGIREEPRPLRAVQPRQREHHCSQGPGPLSHEEASGQMSGFWKNTELESNCQLLLNSCKCVSRSHHVSVILMLDFICESYPPISSHTIKKQFNTLQSRAHQKFQEGPQCSVSHMCV